MKKFFALALVLCALLAGCNSQKPISNTEAIQIVLDEANLTVDKALPHVHKGEHDGKECFLVYVTVGKKNMVYSVDLYTGEILSVEESSHSH